jgi:hypothetical protein
MTKTTLDSINAKFWPMQFLGPSPKGVYLCRRTVLALVRACRACVRVVRVVRGVSLLVTEAAGSESLGVEGERVVPQIVRSVQQPRPHLNIGLRKGAWLEGRRAPGKVQPRNKLRVPLWASGRPGHPSRAKCPGW